MGMKIAEGSTWEIEIEEHKMFYITIQDKGGGVVAIHTNDIPELIKELERISKNEDGE